MKKNILFVALFFILIFQYTFSQDIVISEYANGTTPADEWVELLVISDNLDISGYKLRDNSQSGQWMGGIVFNRIPLWEHLRAGTAIVIHFRGTSVADADPSDGYLEIGAENTSYFTKFMSNGTINEWNEKAMNLLITSDILQILSKDDTHVHSLSHMTTLSQAYNDIRGAKTNHEGECKVGASIRVVPGLNIEAYRSGSGKENTEESTALISMGMPNRSSVQSKDYLNQLYWRYLRQPRWRQSKPAMTVQQFADSCILQWDLSQDSYPQDKMQGYLIIRIELPVNDNRDISSIIPEDGKVYKAGDKIGIGEVLANVESSQIQRYTDKKTTNCGFKYHYRVFSFRFTKDQQAADGDPRNARGRSYEENTYPEARIIKEIPANPELSGDTYHLCKGSKVRITVLNQFQNITYKWYKNFSPAEYISTNPFIEINEAGSYYVEAINESNCTAKAYFEVIAHDTPIAYIFDKSGKSFQNDTTLYLCPNYHVKVSTNDNAEFIWLKNGLRAPAKFQVITPEIDEPGDYQVVHFVEGACSDTSITVKIVEYDISFKSNIDTLWLNISSSEDYKDGEIELTLDSPGINIEVDVFGGVQIISPELPLILKPGLNKIIVRVAPIDEGEYALPLFLIGGCNGWDTVIVAGKKEFRERYLKASVKSLDFGSLISCQLAESDTVITLKNDSPSELTISQPSVGNPFSIIEPEFPTKISAGGEIQLKLAVENFPDGIFSDFLKIPYYKEDENFYDTLRMSVKAEIHTPDFKFNTANIEFPKLTECQSTTTRSISITNTSKVDISFTEQPQDSRFKILHLPITLKAGVSGILQFEYTALTTGNDNIPVTVVSNPCSVEQSFVASISKVGVVYNLQPDTLDFGTIWNCYPDISVKKELNMNASSLEVHPDSLYIKNVTTPDGFAALIEPGIKINQGDMKIPVVFIPAFEGDFTGEIQFTLMPCEVMKKAVLKGSRRDLNYSVEGQIDFGKIYPDEKVTKQLHFRNTSNSAITVNSIVGITAPYFIGQANPSFPIVLEPNSELVYNIDYTTNQTGIDSLVITLSLSEPCSKEIAVLLIGECSNPPVVKVNIKLPEAIISDEGRIFTIPVTIENTSDSLKFAGISMVEIKLAYNPTMMFPDDGRAGTAAEQTSSFLLAEELMGLTSVKFDISDPSLITNGVFAEIDFLALSGNEPISYISVDTVIFQSKLPIEYVTNVAKCEVSGLCLPGQRIVEIGSAAAMTFVCPQPLTDDCEIEYKTAIDGQLSVAIYNGQGDMIYQIYYGYANHGSYSSIVPVTNMSNGMYFVVLKSGISTKILKFIVNK